MIAKVVMLVGAILVFVSALGVVRFPDALSRMHALTKASTVGLGLVAIGAAFLLPTANDVTTALLAAALYVVTLPISSSLIGRSTYLSDESPVELDEPDELADRHHFDDPGDGRASSTIRRDQP